MSYEYKDRKIVCVIKSDLEQWQAMNVVGHLAIALGANKDGQLMGRNTLPDASGITHTGIARYGLIIKKGTVDNIRHALAHARQNPNLIIADFPREMLDTGHDDELADWIHKKAETDFEYLGAIFYGPTSDVNGLAKDLPLWG